MIRSRRALRLRGLAFGALLLMLGRSGVEIEPPASPAVAPASRGGDWLDLHEAFVATAARGGVDLLFLGDSITAFWLTTARDEWDRRYAPRKAANFGIGSDRTQNLLWRLDRGELDGIQPRVVVVMIGTNNLPHDPEDQVLAGVAAVVGRVRSRLPAAKVLLLGLTPRGIDCDPGQATTAPDPRVAALNRRLARLADGRSVEFLDFGPALLDDRGRLVQVVQPDFLHLSRAAYRAWADLMEPTLRRMLAPERAPGPRSIGAQPGRVR